MAASRALAGQGEAVEDSEHVITSALTYMVWCSLPNVSSDGATTTQKYGDVKEFRANGGGQIEIVDFYGRRVCIVPPFGHLVLKARNPNSYSDDSSNTRPSLPSWEVFGPGHSKGGVKGVHLADLAVTDGATTATSVTLSTSYVEATVEAEIDAAIDALSAEMLADLTVSFREVEGSVNAIIAQLALMGLIGDIDLSEGTDTLALADNTDWQVIDDSERLVTNSRANPVYCTLPDVTSAGTSATAKLKQNVKFQNTGGGAIVVRDFQHRFVCMVPDETTLSVRCVLAASTSGYQWIVEDEIDSELTLAITRVATIAPLIVTLPTMAASAIDLAASYSDADIEAAMDLALDGVFVTGATGLDEQLDAAFAEVEAKVNAILVALETTTTNAAA